MPGDGALGGALRRTINAQLLANIYKQQTSARRECPFRAFIVSTISAPVLHALFGDNYNKQASLFW